MIRLAGEAGGAFAAQPRGQRDKIALDDPADLFAYDEILELWQQDGDLTINLKIKERDRLEFDVRRCRIRLTRTQTIMEGAGHCDFRYRMAKDN